SNVALVVQRRRVDKEKGHTVTSRVGRSGRIPIARRQTFIPMICTASRGGRFPSRSKYNLHMSYAVKEIYYALQGEGAQTGRPAVFLRFAGCNLWSGREADRGTGGSCSAWCDTDFVGTDGPGGGHFESARQLALAVAACWPAGSPAAR